MADINDKVNTALASVFQYFYNGMPEFAENEEPETYAVYFIRERPDCFASGVYHVKRYWVPVSIITLLYDRTLYSQNEKAFADAGFIYTGGSDSDGYESSSPYPHRYMFTQDFLIDMEV